MAGLKRKAGKLLQWIGALTVALVLGVAVYGAVRVTDDEPVTWDDDVDHFKYGSTGGERGHGYQFGFGVPYWVWIALPELFPDHLPDGEAGRGYASFGMIYEEGRDARFDLPVGMSMRRVKGIDRVYFNCAVCHTGSVREAPGAEPTIVAGMPANTFDLGRLSAFLSDAASDWRFRSSRMFPTIDNLARARDAAHPEADGYRPDPLNPVDRAVFRYLAISLMREQLLTLTSRLAFVDVESWGPGRVDTFNPPKALLGFPMEKAPAREKVGNADFPSVWNQRWKEGMQLHWDGNNTAVDERNLSAGFGTGATPTTLDRDKILRTAAWLWDGAKPAPFPEARIDRARVEEGAAVYREACRSCHGSGSPPFRAEGDGSRVGRVTPVAEVGTDRWRLDSYTPELAAAQNSLYAGFPAAGAACDDGPQADGCYPARFSHFRKTFGYANMPLDGLWLRAPYLHNGSVPTLRDLLEPPEARPAVFHTGWDVYDFDAVGFVTSGPGAEAGGWRYDTALPGNGNGGHLYGVDLAPEAKRALLEYLKTF